MSVNDAGRRRVDDASLREGGREETGVDWAQDIAALLKGAKVSVERAIGVYPEEEVDGVDAVQKVGGTDPEMGPDLGY